MAGRGLAWTGDVIVGRGRVSSAVAVIFLVFLPPLHFAPSSARCYRNNTDQSQPKHSHSGGSTVTTLGPDLLIGPTKGPENVRDEGPPPGVRKAHGPTSARWEAFSQCPSSKKHISRRPRLNYLKRIIIDLYPNSSERYIKI